MTAPQNQKGHQTPSSTGTSSKRKASGPRTRGGATSAFGSCQRSETSSSNATKFRPNSMAETRFNSSFSSRLVFISQGILLSDFFETMIYTYFHNWGWDRMDVPIGFVCPRILCEYPCSGQGS